MAQYVDAEARLQELYESPLARIGGNMILVSALVSLLVTMAVLVSGQRTFEHGRGLDALAGPVAVIVLVGMLVSSAALGRVGGAVQLSSDALRVPFGLLVAGVGLWAALRDPREVDAFTLRSLSEPGSRTVQAAWWLGAAALVGVELVRMYVSGHLRPSTFVLSAGGMLVYLAACALLAVGATRFFVRAVEFASADLESRWSGSPEDAGRRGSARDRPETAVVYTVGFFCVLLVVLAGVMFLETVAKAVYSRGFMTPDNLSPDAVLVLQQSRRALRYSLMTVVFISAAYTWRNRHGLVPPEPPATGSGPAGTTAAAAARDDSAESLARAFLLLPALVLVSTAFRGQPEVMNFVRVVALTGVVVYVAMGVVPWNTVTVVAGVILVAVAMRRLGYGNNAAAWLVTSLFCAQSFVAFRGAFLQRTEGMKSSLVGKLLRVLVVVVACGALGVGVATISQILRRESETHLLHNPTTDVYASLIFISFVLSYFALSEGPLGGRLGSPEEVEAEYATRTGQVVDVLILCASLSIMTGIWNLLALPGVRGEGERSVDTPVALVLYACLGFGSAVMYMRLRKSRDVLYWAEEAQKGPRSVADKLLRSF